LLDSSVGGDVALGEAAARGRRLQAGDELAGMRRRTVVEPPSRTGGVNTVAPIQVNA
jgi:hypothetical protein